MHALIKAGELIVSLPLMFYVPGFFLLRTRASSGLALNKIERFMLMIVTSVSITSILSLLTAEAGILKLKILVPMLLVISVAIRLAGGHNPRPVPRSRGGLLQLALVIILVVLSVSVFFKPADWVTGDGDPGVYFNVGNNVAKTGSLIIKDKKIESYGKDEVALFLSRRSEFVGFRVKERKAGEVETRLYHMLPGWIGIFIRLFGLRGGLYVSPLFAVMSVLLAFCLGRRLAGTFGGLVASVLLSVASIQIWFARIPASEMLEQFFLLATLLVMVLHFSHEHRLFPLILGLSFTSLLLSKVEALLFLVPIAVAFAVRMLLGRYGRADRAVVNAALACATVSLLYARFFLSWTFLVLLKSSFQSIRWIPWKVNTENSNLVLIFLVPVALLALLFNWGAVNRLMARIGGWAAAMLKSRGLRSIHWFRALGALSLLGVFIYLYMLPGHSPAFLSAETNFLRFSWMMGGAFVFILVVGVCALVYVSDPPVSAFMFTSLMLVAYLFFLHYTGQYSVPWESRRYITIVVPLLLLGTGCLANLLWKQRHILLKLAAISVAVIVLVSFAPASRAVLKETHYGGAEAQLAQIASITPEQPVGLLMGKFESLVIGPPLRYLYGKDVRFISNRVPQYARRLSEVVNKYKSEGREFLVTGPSEEIYNYTPWLSFNDTGIVSGLDTPFFMARSDSPPRDWGRLRIPVHYYSAQPGSPIRPSPGRGFTINVGSDDLGYVKGLLRQDLNGQAFWRVRGLPVGIWDRSGGISSSLVKSLEKSGSAPFSRVKLPLAGGKLPIQVRIVAGPQGPPAPPLVVFANREKPELTTSYENGSPVYSLVIRPKTQLTDCQKLLLLSRGSEPFDPNGEILMGMPLVQIEAAYGRPR